MSIQAPKDSTAWWSLFMEHLEAIVEYNEKATTGIETETIRDCAASHNFVRARVILSLIVSRCVGVMPVYDKETWNIIRVLDRCYEECYK